ncbi:rhodanese-like domain-containing protein [uncultured Mucilaginibacter sp.]|uniref:rhodanese-like domain-containing protein n=1 Tax=uncultured Mucilaginibacter sp. TaxID=797541 RepID=UPI0025E266F9|nr:rhodanese-like domain-containing protein [uncultured Mucilaginibacter sp.]
MDISAAELSERIGKGEVLNILDVRGEMEYSTFNIGGQNLPLPKLASNIDDVEYGQDDEIITVCTMGLRSTTGKALLNQNGFTNVRNLKGGLIELQKLKKDQ